MKSLMTQYKKRPALNGWKAPLFIALIAVIQGCNGLNLGNAFLAEPPEVDVTKDTVFNHAKYAKQFLYYTYETLYSGIGQDCCFDVSQLGDHSLLASLTDINQDQNINNGAPSVYYYTGSYSAQVEAQDPTSMKFNFESDGAWRGIRNSYIFLENVDRVPDMSVQEKKRLKAEARMIIAYHYIRFFRNYGGMIWVDHAYSATEDFHLPRMTARATLDSTLALINMAIPDLPFTLPNPEKWAGRFTQAGAMALKIRLLLFAASPLFNSNQPYLTGEASSKKLTWYGGYDPSLWQKAVEACKDFLQKNQQEGYPYHLVNTGHPQEDFRSGYLYRRSPELLVQVQKDYKGERGANGYPTSLINEGVGTTTDNYVKMFPMADGTPIDQPGSGYDPTHPYANRDPRLYETVLTNGAPYQGRTAEIWVGGREHKTINYLTTRTGYRVFKFILDGRSSKGLHQMWPALRLSEIYLSYAEALDQVNGGPTPEAYKYVNMVRNRAGLDDLPTGMNKEQFRKAVVLERVLELGYEEVRWWDLIRWKMKDNFTKTLYGMRIWKKGTPEAVNAKDLGYGYHESDQYIYVRYKIPDRYWKVNFSPKWYLSAFPQDEINKGYGLIQNPGW